MDFHRGGSGGDAAEHQPFHAEGVRRAEYRADIVQAPDIVQHYRKGDFLFGAVGLEGVAPHVEDCLFFHLWVRLPGFQTAKLRFFRNFVLPDGVILQDDFPAVRKNSNIIIMETTRQAKIARLLQKELSEILRLQTAKTHGILISVSSVRVSPDLSVAKAYLSIFPSAQAQTILENLTRNARTIRYDLGQKVRFQLRKVPELAFYLDDSLDYAENIDRLLGQEAKELSAAPDASASGKEEE